MAHDAGNKGLTPLQNMQNTELNSALKGFSLGSRLAFCAVSAARGSSQGFA